jgi:ABC-type sugar transport system ATPase subunit
VVLLLEASIGPDAGTITLAREQLDITTIHQELPVAPALTTLDNVWISA